MDASINQHIQHYFEEKKAGMSFLEIRKRLEALDIEPQKIEIIIRDIDRKILRDEKIKVANQKARELIIIGAIGVIFGLVVTIGTYTELIDSGSSYIVMYGPIFGGLGFLITGYSKYTKR